MSSRIRNEAELDRAIRMIDGLLNEPRLSSGAKAYLEVLTRLVEAYEDQHEAIEPASDGDLVKLLLDERDLRPAQLSRETGICDSTISSVMSGRRRLTRDQVTTLSQYFSVSPAVFA